MTLSNNNCSSIDITSSYIDDVLSNPSSYDRIEIKAKVNCCDTEYTDTVTLAVAPTDILWDAVIPFSSTLLISKVQLKNILTGQLIPIVLPTPVAIASTVDFVTVTNYINSYLAVNYGPAVQVIGSASQEDDYTYQLYNFVHNFLPVSVTYSIDGIEATATFLSQASSKNSTLTSTGLSLSPLLFGSDSFADGVYSIEVSTVKPTGSRAITSNCLFLDCKTACDLAKILPTLSASAKIEALMLHYSLTVGTNCPCECNMLCDSYRDLYSILYKSVMTDSCGCN